LSPGRGFIENRNREWKSEFPSSFSDLLFLAAFLAGVKWVGPTERKRSVGDCNRGGQAFYDTLRTGDAQICGCSEKMTWAAFLGSFLTLRHTKALLREAVRKKVIGAYSQWPPYLD